MRKKFAPSLERVKNGNPYVNDLDVSFGYVQQPVSVISESREFHYECEVTVWLDQKVKVLGGQPLFRRSFELSFMPLEVLIDSLRNMFGDKAVFQFDVVYTDIPLSHA